MNISNNKTKRAVLIGIISFIIPFSIYLISRLDVDNIPREPSPLIDPMTLSGKENDVIIEQMLIKIEDIISQLNTQQQAIVQSSPHPVKIFPEVEPQVFWLDSPVMQKWQWDAKERVWTTALPYKESMRSNPSIIIGLREDGVVIWKKIEK